MSLFLAVPDRSRLKILARTTALVFMTIGPCVGAIAADLPGHLPQVVVQARPKREADLIAIHEDARRQLADARTNDNRTGVRLRMQTRVQDLLLPDTSMVDWTGVLQDVSKTNEGDVAIKIEIAPNIMILTPQNRLDDRYHVMLVRAGSPVAKALSHLHLGDSVVFSGQIVQILIENDEEMIARPIMAAHFDSMKLLVAVGGGNSH
jgi:hypothetical protein